jgi:hypothetical protein
MPQTARPLWSASKFLTIWWSVGLYTRVRERMNTSDGSSRLPCVTSIAHTSPLPRQDQESKEDCKTTADSCWERRRHSNGRKLLGRRMRDLCSFLRDLSVPLFWKTFEARHSKFCLAIDHTDRLCGLVVRDPAWWRNAPSNVGTPKILLICHAATSFIVAPPARHPNTYFNPKAAISFIVAKTQALPNSDSIQPLPPFLSCQKAETPKF